MTGGTGGGRTAQGVTAAVQASAPTPAPGIPAPMLELTGRSAVIVGASAGIGAEIARLFARRGAAVVLVARRAELLADLEREIKAAGGTALAVPGDVTDTACPERVMATTVEWQGKVDILVNNAGIADHLWGAARVSDELWERVVAVNQTAPFRFAREALARMTAQGFGNIINISSIGGVYSIAGAAYSASKIALIGLTKNIAVQYAGTAIRCNAVCPGPTLTGMLGDGQPEDEQMKAAVGRRVDITVGPSETIDVANAVLFLACDESRYINGQYIVIDKGGCI
jgi:NAD(P)-dependent dehydrogenase (short-subunit alcohol dehydrogenase family)